MSDKNVDGKVFFKGELLRKTDFLLNETNDSGAFEYRSQFLEALKALTPESSSEEDRGEEYIELLTTHFTRPAPVAENPNRRIPIIEPVSPEGVISDEERFLRIWFNANPPSGIFKFDSSQPVEPKLRIGTIDAIELAGNNLIIDSYWCQGFGDIFRVEILTTETRVIRVIISPVE